jgi:hypothetical protein
MLSCMGGVVICISLSSDFSHYDSYHVLPNAISLVNRSEVTLDAQCVPLTR